MKLKVKQTILVGLAFFSISAFWQLYEPIMPLMLKYTFNQPEVVSGIIMAADNILALVLLPFFGSLSDKTHTKLGKRTPFIIFGTAGAVLFMNLLPIFDNAYAANPSVPFLVLFILSLGCVLLFMSIYRSPAVALMPDVTPKPLRSKGNAIINLMGSAGGMISMALATVLYPDKPKADDVNISAGDVLHINYQLIFVIVAAVMLVSVAVMVLTVRENKLSAEAEKYNDDLADNTSDQKDPQKNTKLPVAVRRSLIFMLLSVALWYMGYNAVSTNFSKYVTEMMDGGLGSATMYMLIGNAGALISFVPLGIISSKIGRKKTILVGAGVLAACLASGYLLTVVFNPNEQQFVKYIMYVVFVLVGISWAAINVNSFPMVVEMCKGSDTGKFTGYYYAFSMAAQVATPILVGLLFDIFNYEILFPYAAIFVALSFCTMLFVKHGDAKIESKKGIEAFESMDAD